MAARKTATTSSTSASRAKAPEASTPDPAEEYAQVISRTDSDRPFVTSNRFSVANVEVRGRELLALAPTHHVGPAPILVPMAELDELIADLTALRDAPGFGQGAEESE